VCRLLDLKNTYYLNWFRVVISLSPFCHCWTDCGIILFVLAHLLIHHTHALPLGSPSLFNYILTTYSFLLILPSVPCGRFAFLRQLHHHMIYFHVFYSFLIYFHSIPLFLPCVIHILSTFYQLDAVSPIFLVFSRKKLMYLLTRTISTYLHCPHLRSCFSLIFIWIHLSFILFITLIVLYCLPQLVLASHFIWVPFITLHIIYCSFMSWSVLSHVLSEEQSKDGSDGVSDDGCLTIVQCHHYHWPPSSDLYWSSVGILPPLRYHQQNLHSYHCHYQPAPCAIYRSTTRAPPCSTHVPCSRPITLRMHQFSRSWVAVTTRTCKVLRWHPSAPSGIESPHYMFILLPYALHVNSLYVYVLLLYKYSSLLYVFC